MLELVRFDADADAGERLRVWDRIDGDLIERIVIDDRSESALLDHGWVVAPDEEHPVALRLETRSGALIPTVSEADRERAEAEKQKQESEKQRQEAEKQRQEAEETIARLRGELEALKRT